jgi:hypothetical protein
MRFAAFDIGHAIDDDRVIVRLWFGWYEFGRIGLVRGNEPRLRSGLSHRVFVRRR